MSSKKTEVRPSLHSSASRQALHSSVKQEEWEGGSNKISSICGLRLFTKSDKSTKVTSVSGATLEC